MKLKTKPKKRVVKTRTPPADFISPVLEKGKKLLEQRHLDESDKIFQTLARNGIEGLYGMGLVRLSAGKLNDAAAYFHKCVQVDDRHANSYFYLGHILERMKSLRSAHALYLKALSLKPGHSAAQARLVALENYRGRGISELGRVGPKLNVILRDSGQDKINVLIAIGQETGKDLKEAKRLIDAVPQILKEVATKDEAIAIKKKFEALGAKVEIK